MAIIWEHKAPERKYKVTQAGRTVRLYRNDVCHSQWNPTRPFSGHLWDLFCLSLFQQKIQNACVLGVGGGSVINSLQALFPTINIVGVDLDEVHIYVAKKFFGVGERCQLIHEDAFEWLKKQKPNTFDCIIDDVFSESSKMPFRSVDTNQNWFERQLAVLKDHGTLITNYADINEWREAREHLSRIKDIGTYQCGLAQHFQCENNIVHLSRRDLSSQQLRSQIKASQHTILTSLWDKGVLRYRKSQLIYRGD